MFVQPVGGHCLTHVERHSNLPIELRPEGTAHGIWDHLELHVRVVVSQCRIDRRGTKELLQQVVDNDLGAVMRRIRFQQEVHNTYLSILNVGP
jgi:hypothetical protein